MKDKIFIFFKNFYRPSSIFLYLVVLLLALNGYISYGNSSNLSVEEVNTQSARIIYKDFSSIFSNRYLGVIDNKFFHFDFIGNNLEGKDIKFSGGFDHYSIEGESYQKYYKTKGIEGVYKINEVLNETCDLGCKLINNSLIIKKFYSSRFSYLFCDYSVPKILKENIYYDCNLFSNISIALLFGDTSNIDEVFKDDTKSLGVYHIFSFSGFQVALIFGWVEIIFIKYLKFYRKLTFFIGISFLSLIIINVGFEMPVVRSSLSIIIQISSIIFLGRKMNSFRALIYSGVLMCIANPLVMFNISFLLSFVATLGVMLSVLLIKYLKRINYFVDILIAYFTPTLFSSLLTYPIVSQFNTQKPIFLIIFSNFVITFFLPIITILLILLPLPILGVFIEPVISSFYLLISLYIDLTK